MDKIIVVDIDKCLGCRSCELACAVAHSGSGVLISAIREKNVSFPRIILERIGNKSLPVHCRHCEDAPCIIVCPSKAMMRSSDQSPVLLDRKKCIGCHACIIACPFGVIKRDRDGKSLIKCDLCFSRLENGKSPACVEACPVNAVRFITIEEAARLKRAAMDRKFRVLIKSDAE